MRFWSRDRSSGGSLTLAWLVMRCRTHTVRLCVSRRICCCWRGWCRQDFQPASRRWRLIGIIRRPVGNRGQPLRQNVRRSHRRRAACQRRFLFFLLSDHQHFFQPAQVGGGLDSDIEKEFRSRRNLGDRAYGQSFGKNLVAAAGHHSFPRLNGFIRHYFFQHHFAERRTAQHSLQTRLLENGPHSAGLIIDQQYL